eukprot:13984851-Heterocapsa_arctica.AAC.1
MIIRTARRVMAKTRARPTRATTTTVPLPERQADKRSTASSTSSADNSPVVPWEEFFADKRRPNDAEALAHSSATSEALARASSDGSQ